MYKINSHVLLCPLLKFTFLSILFIHSLKPSLFVLIGPVDTIPPMARLDVISIRFCIACKLAVWQHKLVA